MTTKQVKTSKKWNVALWIAQVLLAGMFLMTGIMKAFTPITELSKVVLLAGDMPLLTRFIGISELAGALGLLLPAALRIRPQLTVLAAEALALVMLLALIYHLVRGEYAATGTNVLLGVIATFIAWGRLQKAPIAARSSTTTHSPVKQ